jgi:hypothetical protein
MVSTADTISLVCWTFKFHIVKRNKGGQALMGVALKSYIVLSSIDIICQSPECVVYWDIPNLLLVLLKKKNISVRSKFYSGQISPI